jgi:hypothetical protein
MVDLLSAVTIYVMTMGGLIYAFVLFEDGQDAPEPDWHNMGRRM